MNEKDLNNMLIEFGRQARAVEASLNAIIHSFSESDIINKETEIKKLKKELNSLRAITLKIENNIK